jgi:hypothetical protein
MILIVVFVAAGARWSGPGRWGSRDPAFQRETNIAKQQRRLFILPPENFSLDLQNVGPLAGGTE